MRSRICFYDAGKDAIEPASVVHARHERHCVSKWRVHQRDLSVRPRIVLSLTQQVRISLVCVCNNTAGTIFDVWSICLTRQVPDLCDRQLSCADQRHHPHSAAPRCEWSAVALFRKTVFAAAGEIGPGSHSHVVAGSEWSLTREVPGDSRVHDRLNSYCVGQETLQLQLCRVGFGPGHTHMVRAASHLSRERYPVHYYVMD